MALLRYIGLKDRETDNVCNTGVVWHGFGDVQNVPDQFAARMLQHTDMWELAEPPQAPAPAPAPAPASAGGSGEGGGAPKFTLVLPEGNFTLDDATDDELLSLAEELKLKVDRRFKGDRLRQALIDAAAEAAKAAQAAQAAEAAKAAEG